MQRPAKPPTWVQIPDPAILVLPVSFNIFRLLYLSVNKTEVVSSRTHYGDAHLLLEYDKGDITLYDLPAGRIESDEEILNGMVREFREETGLSTLDVENMTAMRPYTYEMDDSSFTVYPFDIELTKKKEPVSLDDGEHSGYRWLSDDQLEREAENGWLNSPKFFNAKYAQAGMNGLEELRGNEGEELVFTDEEVMDNMDDLEALIRSKLV